MLVTISGARDFDRFAEAMSKAARTDFDREMNRSMKDAGEDIATAIRADSEQYMPSGYEQVFAARLLTRVEPGKSFRGVTVIAYAKGRSGRRDVGRLDQGTLRHPVFGRWRVLKAQGKYAKKTGNFVNGAYANPWAVTKIRPGFFSNPVKLVGHKAVKTRGNEGLGRLFDGISKSV